MIFTGRAIDFAFYLYFLVNAHIFLSYTLPSPSSKMHNLNDINHFMMKYKVFSILVFISDSPICVKIFLQEYISGVEK